MFRPLICRACLGAVAVALVALLPVPLAAQEGTLAPTKVTIVGEGTSVTVTWAPVRAEGVTYRVLRALNAKEPGADITKEPVDAASVVDPEVVPGTTYFYQVIAMYRDETSAAAAPVEFTVPKAELVAPIAAPIITSQPIIMSQPISLAGTPKTIMPTAVTGITVNGTTASAIVSWQPVAGAVSYSVTRSTPDGFARSFTGLTTATWTDPGPQNIGFVTAGVYLYQVAADLGGGTSVSGQASWTRPDPTCAPPLPNQPMLTILDPSRQGSDFTSIGGFPGGAGFTWSTVKNSGVIAYLVERSLQATNAWTLAATSCGGASPIAGTWERRFSDGLGGIVPSTTYLYRVTALAANGEAGAHTVPWTAPNPVVLRWLSVTIVGSTVTLKVRYEPPATNAPVSPTSMRITAAYGLDQGPSGPSGCASLAGCSFVVNAVPPGTHKFTITAGWIGARAGYEGWGSGPVIATASAETTVVVP